MNSSRKTTFTERFNELRQASGKTQIQIANDIGAKAQAISYIARGREPSLDLVVKIAHYFGVTTDYLLGSSNCETFKVSTCGDAVQVIMELGERAGAKIEIALDRAGVFFNDCDIAAFLMDYAKMSGLYRVGDITFDVLCVWQDAELRRLQEIPCKKEGDGK